MRELVGESGAATERAPRPSGPPPGKRSVLQSEMPPAEERQTLVFSATHPPEMKALALDCGRDYVSLTAGPGAVAGVASVVCVGAGGGRGWSAWAGAPASPGCGG